MPRSESPEVLSLPGGASGHPLIKQWADAVIRLSRQEADMYSGCRKIIRPWRHTFTLDDSLKLSHVGYSINKLRQLTRHYVHQESIDVAAQLWEARKEKRKYGSVGFTCYNHFIKNDPTKKSKRASVMGPCIQAVTLSWLSKDFVSVDAFYRTTELIKKFPADLVFIRDTLLPHFDLDGMQSTLTCHFANVTVHPMYFVAVIPHIDDPIRRLREIKKVDPYFHDWIVKWSARYLVPKYAHGIAKFEQAKRVQSHAKRTITDKDIIRYLKDNHPGYRR